MISFHMTIHFLTEKIKAESLSYADAVQKNDESGMRLYSGLITEFALAKAILLKAQDFLK